MKSEETREPGKLHFHYDREQRRRSLPERIREPRPRGFLRGNRSLVITLIDLFVIAVLFVIVWFFLRSGNRSDTLEGYHFDLRAVAYDDRVFVTLTIDPRENDLDGGLVQANLRYEEGGIKLTLSDVLPVSEEGNRNLRASIPLDPEAEKIYADLFIAETSLTIQAKIDRE